MADYKHVNEKLYDEYYCPDCGALVSFRRASKAVTATMCSNGHIVERPKVVPDFDSKIPVRSNI